MSEEYDPRPGGRFVSFAQQPGGPPTAPYTWPQDTLQIPDGFGALPRVDPLNVSLVAREFYALYNGFNFPAGINPPISQTVVLPAPKDGDFWFTGLAALFELENTLIGSDENLTLPSCFLQIEDIATNYKMMPQYIAGTGEHISGVSLLSFDLLSNQQGLANLIIPPGAGQRGDFIQPYCFVRGGGVQLSLYWPSWTNFLTNPHFDMTVHVSLVGWKEYANAAA